MKITVIQTRLDPGTAWHYQTESVLSDPNYDITNQLVVSGAILFNVIHPDPYTCEINIQIVDLEAYLQANNLTQLEPVTYDSTNEYGLANGITSTTTVSLD